MNDKANIYYQNDLFAANGEKLSWVHKKSMEIGLEKNRKVALNTN